MNQSPTKKTTASKQTNADNRVTVRNPASPGSMSTVDATKYHAMKDALLQVLPPSAPGLTGAEGGSPAPFARCIISWWRQSGLVAKMCAA